MTVPGGVLSFFFNCWSWIFFLPNCWSWKKPVLIFVDLIHRVQEVYSDLNNESMTMMVSDLP